MLVKVEGIIRTPCRGRGAQEECQGLIKTAGIGDERWQCCGDVVATRMQLVSM